MQPLIATNPGRELCAGDRRQLFSLGENLLSLSSRDDLADCLDRLRAWLDVSEIVVATGTVGNLPEARVVGSGHDAEWMKLYLRERFVLVDPIVSAILHGQRFVNRARATDNGKALVRRARNGPTLERFLEAARDHGRLGYGFASGVVFNDRMALCSVVTGPGRSHSQAPLIMGALRPMLYPALMRVLQREPVVPDLSERELAILEWLASGYNDIQIAEALSISTSTVRFHLGNVFEKLGARNRCHAVAIGFQSGLLQR